LYFASPGFLLFSSTSQEIVWEEHTWNDLFYVEWDVKHLLSWSINQPISRIVIIHYCHCHECMLLSLWSLLWFVVGCNASCPLDEFIELTKKNIPADWHTECNAVAASNS